MSWYQKSANFTRASGRREACATTFFDQPEAAISVQRQDRLGMELHAFNGQFAVAHSHDDAVLRFRSDFKTGGKVSLRANSECSGRP